MRENAIGTSISLDLDLEFGWVIEHGTAGAKRLGKPQHTAEAIEVSAEQRADSRVGIYHYEHHAECCKLRSFGR